MDRRFSVYEQYIATMRERFGWEESRARPCPRVVAGRRCLAWGVEKTCVCEAWFHVLDHRHLWLTKNKTKVLTSEPYDLDLDDVAEFRAALKPMGLSVETAPGIWAPGATTLVVVRGSVGRPS